MPDDPTMDDVRAAAEQVHAELAEQYERRMEVLREATKALIVQLSYKPCAACGLPNPERDGADCNSCADKAEALAEARSALDAGRDEQRTLTEKPELWQEPKCIGGDCRPEWNWRRADCPVHGREEDR